MLEKKSKMDYVSVKEILNRILLLKYGYFGSFASDCVPILDNDTVAIIITQPSNLQGEHGIKITNYRHTLFFADSLARKKYNFLKQHYKQIIPEQLQSHSSVCGSHMINAAFHLFKFRQDKLTVHDVNVLSFISYSM